jgi:hypothetical protein
MMRLETFVLPSHWASPLINADSSGLEESDEKALDSWFDATFPHGAHCLGCGEESAGFMRWHDAAKFALACDCSEFTFDVGAP